MNKFRIILSQDFSLKYVEKEFFYNEILKNHQTPDPIAFGIHSPLMITLNIFGYCKCSGVFSLEEKFVLHFKPRFQKTLLCHWSRLLGVFSPSLPLLLRWSSTHCKP